MKKRLSLLLAIIMLLGLVACDTQSKAIDPNAVYLHLLSDIAYDVPLNDAGDLASIYFTNLPEGSTVRMHVSSSGYYPDEIALITLQNESDYDAAKQAIDAHLAQLRTQFQNYIPEEVATIDGAIVQQFGQYIFLVVTSDRDAVNTLLSKAHELNSDGLTEPTAVPPTPQTTPSTETPVTEPPVTVPPEPVIPELKSKSGTYSVYGSGVVKVDNSAFEPYGYDSYVAGTYAGMVNKVADALAGQTNVYCMPIPTAISVILPDDIIPQYPKYRDQGADIEDIFGKMSSNVIPVNCYQNLLQHRDEYLYFRTDYHWNGPAAYYAYETFCETKGITPYTMEQRECVEFDNFLGILYYNNSGRDPELSATPDTVVAYYPYNQGNSMIYQDTSGNRYAWQIISDVSNIGSNGKFLCFAAADQPYAEFHNENVTDGSVLIVVKESYGNVLMSYVVDHYSTVYEIDYRYWNGNLINFAQQVGATDILFANNLTMISAGVLVGMMTRIIP